MGSIGGYFLPYYSKEHILTKDTIFKIFQEDQQLLQYLPTNPKLQTIPREFLLSVLANVNRQKFAQLYSQYKEIKVQRSTMGNKLFKAQITEQFLNGLQNFTPINL